MDDDIKNQPQNQSSSSSNSIPNSTPVPEEIKEADASQEQPGPIYESVTVEEAPTTTTPEEVSADVEETEVGDMTEPTSQIPSEPPMMTPEDNRGKYFIIGGGALLFLILLVVIFKAIFSGQTKPKEVNLTYWGLWEEKEIFTPLIELYQKKYPYVKINYQKMSPQDYLDRLLARSKNNQGPDIFRFHNTWLPQIKELATPIPQSIMSNDEFDKTFYKIFQTDLKSGNYYYGLPFYLDGLVLISNDGLLKKAGILLPPANWDEITDAVSKLTVKDKSGQIITAGIALGTTSNVEHFSDIFGLMLLQNGGDLKKLDQPEAAGALESYRKFAEPPNDFWSDSMSNSLAAFTQERVAMIIAPSWQILSIKAANPDLKIKVTTVPTVPGGRPVSLATYWVEGVSRYSSNQLEAWKFLKFLTEKDNLTRLYQLESQTKLFGEAYSRVDLGQLLTQNEYLGAVIRQADYYRSLPLSSRTFDNGLNTDIIKYIENAINATVQGVSYDEALKTAKQGIDQIYEKYKIN